MNLLNPVLSFVFPVFCSNCSELVESINNGAACEECWRRTLLFDGNETACYKCGKLHSLKQSTIRTYCRECDDDYYDLARACGPYDNAIAATVLSLKRTPVLAKRPIDLLFDCYVRSPFREIDLLVPIPLSKRRYFERGFNQAEIIARTLSKVAGIKLDDLSLVRNKHSKKSRAAMDRKGRAMTVKNAFIVRRANLLRGKRLLLIDDVLTSGATASMAAKALKKNGAARVEVLTLARAGF